MNKGKDRESADAPISEEEALEMMGFREGEQVSYIASHFIPGTKEVCGSITGTVASVTAGGKVAYVKCDSCGDVLREEL